MYIISFIFIMTQLVHYLYCSIYAEIGEYDPAETTKDQKKEKERVREKERKKSKTPGDYFEKPGTDDREVRLQELKFDKTLQDFRMFHSSFDPIFVKFFINVLSFLLSTEEV